MHLLKVVLSVYFDSNAANSAELVYRSLFLPAFPSSTWLKRELQIPPYFVIASCLLFLIIIVIAYYHEMRAKHDDNIQKKSLLLYLW